MERIAEVGTGDMLVGVYRDADTAYGVVIITQIGHVETAADLTRVQALEIARSLVKAAHPDHTMLLERPARPDVPIGFDPDDYPLEERKDTPMATVTTIDGQDGAVLQLEGNATGGVRLYVQRESPGGAICLDSDAAKELARAILARADPGVVYGPVKPATPPQEPAAPMFILKATDRLAVPTIHGWISSAQERGVPRAKIEGAIKTLAAFITWQLDHPTKLPD